MLEEDGLPVRPGTVEHSCNALRLHPNAGPLQHPLQCGSICAGEPDSSVKAVTTPSHSVRACNHSRLTDGHPVVLHHLTGIFRLFQCHLNMCGCEMQVHWFSVGGTAVPASWPPTQPKTCLKKGTCSSIEATAPSIGPGMPAHSHQLAQALWCNLDLSQGLKLPTPTSRMLLAVGRSDPIKFRRQGKPRCVALGIIQGSHDMDSVTA